MIQLIMYLLDSILIFFGKTFDTFVFEEFYQGLGSELGFIPNGTDTMCHFTTVGADIIDRGDNIGLSLSSISIRN